MSLLLPHLRRVRIEAKGLTATQWSSPQEKAKLANAILAFVAKGLPEEGSARRCTSASARCGGLSPALTGTALRAGISARRRGVSPSSIRSSRAAGSAIPPGPGQTWKAGSRHFWSSIRCLTCIALNCGRKRSGANRRCCADCSTVTACRPIMQAAFHWLRRYLHLCPGSSLFRWVCSDTLRCP